MNPESPPTSPTLRQRFSLYPNQLLGAMVLVSLGPLLDPMMRDLGFPLGQGGLVTAAFFLGGVLGIVIVNAGMARVPAKWAFVVGSTLNGAALLAAGLASWDLWSLSLAYVLVGLSGSLINTVSWMWLSAHAKKNAAASALILILFFGVGMVITPIVLGLAMDRGASWRWVLAIEGGISLALALVYFFLPLLDVPGRQNVRLSHLKQVVTHNRGLLLGITGACFMYAGAETTLNVWLPKFQIDVSNTSDTWASLTVTLFWVGLVAGRLLILPLTRRFAPSRLLLICAGVLAVFVVLLALVPSQVASLALSVCAGLGASASYALIGSYSGRFPQWQSGVVSSLFILAGGVGSIVFPYMLGPLASAAGFRVAMAVVVVPVLAYGLFSLLIHARSGEKRA
jgi:MFS transporter, FHS family, glucose/mannose:H+ symporter